MNNELNMTEALMKMQVDAPEIVGQMERDKKFKGVTFTFEENGRRYDLTLSRAKS